LPRPIFDLSSGSGLKTIAHHADMRQMANQEMKRSFRDPCGAASARKWLEKYPSRRHRDLASKRVWPAQTSRWRVCGCPAGRLRHRRKSKAKSCCYALKSGTGKTPGAIAGFVLASSIKDGAALDF
jgi:hypothetical protein